MAGKEPSVPERMTLERFIDVIRANPAAAAAYFNTLSEDEQADLLINALQIDPAIAGDHFDGLSPLQQARLRQYDLIDDWSQDRQAVLNQFINNIQADPAAAAAIAAYAAYFDGLSHLQQDRLLQDPQIRQWSQTRRFLDGVVSYIESDSEAANAYFDALSQQELAFLLQDPRIHQWSQYRPVRDGFINNLQADPEGTAAGFDGLPEEDQAVLLQDPRVRGWLQHRLAREYLDESGSLGLFLYYLSQPDPVRLAIDDDPDLSSCVQEFAEYFFELKGWYLRDDVTDEARLERWNQLDDQAHEALIEIDETGWIGRWAASQVQPVQAQPDESGIRAQAAIDEWRALMGTPAHMDRRNGDVLRDLTDGDQVPFMQAGDLLGIGRDFYYMNVFPRGTPWGTLTVNKPLSPDTDPKASGMITVTGCTDQEGFQAAIARIPADVFLVSVTFV